MASDSEPRNLFQLTPNMGPKPPEISVIWKQTRTSLSLSRPLRLIRSLNCSWY